MFRPDREASISGEVRAIGLKSAAGSRPEITGRGGGRVGMPRTSCAIWNPTLPSSSSAKRSGLVEFQTANCKMFPSATKSLCRVNRISERTPAPEARPYRESTAELKREQVQEA